MTPRNVAIMLFENVEVLDFAGPFEVFHVTAKFNEPTPFNVYTIAEAPGPISARGGLSVNPHYTLADAPQADILLIPGGRGTRALLVKPEIITWVQDQAQQVELLLSVCTGSLVLGKAGLLEGLRATTHHTTFDDLQALAPTATIDRQARYVDNGRIITSGGISAGIDMALYVAARLLGPDAIQPTLKEMEYRWQPEG